MSKSVFKGVLILTSANIITKILGFFYRVYMSKVIGAEGMGLFQLIMPLYMLIWSISSSGFSTTISKLVSEENAKRNYSNSKLILNQCLITSTLISVILSIILFSYSDYIAIKIFKDSRIELPLNIMTLCFPFMAAGSCIRGYFFGSQETVVPAVSQVLEQISKMLVIYILSSFFIPLGLSYAAGVAVIGMCAGEIFSFLYVWLTYRSKINSLSQNQNISIKKGKSYIKILKMSTPLTANRVMNSFLMTVENILIPQKLRAFGYSEQKAMSVFGQLTGMTMPLVMFPSSLITSLSISLVPVISEAITIKETKIINSTISKTFLFTSIISIGTSGLLITFPTELGEVIYSQTEVGNQLFLMGFVCPLIYFQVTLSGILNGLGEQFFIFKNNLISSIISISCIYFITPILGINGFILGYFISFLIVNIFGINKIHRRIKFKINFIHSIIMPIICIVASCLTSKLIYKYCLEFLGQTISLVVSLSFLGIFYLFLLVSLNCLKMQELSMLKFRYSKFYK